MEDVHMPTVPSGAQVNGVNGTAPKTFAELTAEKERLEGELSTLSAVLDSVSPKPVILRWFVLMTNQHNVNMNTSLTTFDGYPRADIDVAQSQRISYTELLQWLMMI
jgi:26S proteasome regulatory subunit N4